jgi:DNA-binding LytR/AlgR family response regulator
MKPVSVFIVEDKAVIAESIEKMLMQAGFYVAGKATRGEAVLEQVKIALPDIILMDIQLAGKMDGIATAEKIKETITIPIIYLTDFSDVATVERAKKTQPANYLLKPFDAKGLRIAIEVAFYNTSKGITPPSGEIKAVETTSFKVENNLFIKDGDMLFRITIEDIIWIEAGGSYCYVHAKTKKYTRTVSLKDFLEELNHPDIIRIHRSHAVNIRHVTSINGNVVMLAAAKNKELQIGENYKQEVHNHYRAI